MRFPCAKKVDVLLYPCVRKSQGFDLQVFAARANAALPTKPQLVTAAEGQPPPPSPALHLEELIATVLQIRSHQSGYRHPPKGSFARGGL